jgi:hypothetical protein
MSYDLMVFDPAAAPHERAAFVEWYHHQAEWSEGHDYSDPANTTPALRAWYNAIRKVYPALNGPDAVSDDDKIDDAADYSIGHHVIYANFRWSQAEQAYPLVRSLAVTYGVGFYDVSGDAGHGEIHFPGQPLEPASQGVWRDIAKQFRDPETPDEITPGASE